MLQKATKFWSDGSQAVRLPKAFWFEGSEVSVWRIFGFIVLRPLRPEAVAATPPRPSAEPEAPPPCSLEPEPLSTPPSPVAPASQVVQIPVKRRPELVVLEGGRAARPHWARTAEGSRRTLLLAA
jgi:virulence-associated protein VagC